MLSFYAMCLLQSDHDNLTLVEHDMELCAFSLQQLTFFCLYFNIFPLYYHVFIN